jgi:hypothetical protein
LTRGPCAISTADPEAGACVGTVDAELAAVEGRSVLDGVDGSTDDADTTEAAVAEPVAPVVDIGVTVGADVVVSAACTALLQPANPAAATRSPAPISERRDRFIHTPPD